MGAHVFIVDMRWSNTYFIYIYIYIYVCFYNIYGYISITPAHYWGVYKLGSGMSHITIHCSHANTMARKGSSSSTWMKKSKAEQFAKEAESAVSRMLKQILSQKV